MLRRLFTLREDIDRFEARALEDGEITTGYKGQLVLHPALWRADALKLELRHLEDRFGLNPSAGLSLGLRALGARKGLADLDDLWCCSIHRSGRVTVSDPAIEAWMETRLVYGAG